LTLTRLPSASRSYTTRAACPAHYASVSCGAHRLRHRTPVSKPGYRSTHSNRHVPRAFAGSRGRIAQLQPLVRAERDRGGEREGRAVQPAGPRCAGVRRGAGARFGGEEAAGAGQRGARGVVGVVLRISRCGRRRRGGGSGEGSRGSSALVETSSSPATALIVSRTTNPMGPGPVEAACLSSSLSSSGGSGSPVMAWSLMASWFPFQTGCWPMPAPRRMICLICPSMS